MIPITAVDVRDSEPHVLAVLRSGILAQGPMVERFEAAVAEMAGTRHAVAVANGTVALAAALQALGLGPGDEVVTSPFTFVATLNAILGTGATARFADIREDDFCVDPDAMAAAIGPNTAALLPVHLYGQSADMGKIEAVADEHGLHLVEDASQAHGATFQGRPVGDFGTGCFSFYATKNVTSAEGGAITTDDDALAEHLRLLRNQGMRQRYRYELAGYNYRLTDLHAAVAIPQLERLPRLVAQRKENAARLSAGLAELPGLRVPRELPGRSHVWHQYTVLVTNDAPVTRDELAARLAELGVGSGVYYPRVVFDHPCYREHPNVIAAEVPVAARVARQCLSIPVHTALSHADVDTVIAAVREVFAA
ncbi:aminotransferase [Longimycelium tulufanense]|uniref:Aminotransferase n=1 Tax=Longimycelium tulufanense TaxID=907463 RepID=A0A8J3FTP6_9PSEU|nr:DegT/DnrJ/EryC1/StrS family aminotransferase [Longimycelium tulufanense]GGM47919.1 aminotransferase [Longimycelium tulufanense]